MSRDAKVGLVIVFAFVFLLGTILVHRMQGNSGELALTDAGAGDATTGDPVGSGGDADPVSPASSLAATTVDAAAEDLESAAPQNVFRPPQNSVFGPAPRAADRTDGSRNNPFSSRSTPATKEPPDSGAHIALSEPDEERQTAAIVERTDSAMNALANNRNESHERSPIDTDNSGPIAAPRRTAPLLDIRSRPHVPPVEPPADEPDSGSLITGNRRPERDTHADMIDQERTAADASMESNPTTERSMTRTIPQLDTPPSGRTPPEFEEATDSRADTIQPAAGDRTPDPKDSAPPRLPKFGEPPEPTIEAVPDRGTDRTSPRNSGGLVRHPAAGNDRATAGSPFTAEPPGSRTSRFTESEPTPARTTGEKNYTVESGDSFWSISAKQYGTGKYFRALEEYNRDRVKSSDGTLKPGMVIVLPDVSVLKMRPATSASIPANRTSGTATSRDSLTAPATDRPVPRRELRTSDPMDATGQSAPTGASRPAAGSSNSSRTNVHIVEEGDTLSEIALRKLGTSKRWDEIYRLNKDRIADPNRLKVGTELKLPAASPENAADRFRTGR
jgi:nucleoid-associated protein YgaU